ASAGFAIPEAGRRIHEPLARQPAARGHASGAPRARRSAGSGDPVLAGRRGRLVEELSRPTRGGAPLEPLLRSRAGLRRALLARPARAARPRGRPSVREQSQRLSRSGGRLGAVAAAARLRAAVRATAVGGEAAQASARG